MDRTARAGIFAALVFAMTASVGRAQHPVPPDPPSIQTVLVAYTEAAAANATSFPLGSTPAEAWGDIDAIIEQMVEDANLTYANSEIDLRLSLVHTFQLDAAEFEESGDFDEDFARFEQAAQDPSDPLGIRKLRDRWAADLVVLVLDHAGWDEDSLCIGTASSEGGQPDAERAFAAVGRACVSTTARERFAFAREIGHLQGAAHDPAVAPNPDFARGYGHSLVGASGPRHTVMFEEPPLSNPLYTRPHVTRLPYWSSPLLEWEGVPLGTSQSQDNARVLVETSRTVANFRTRQEPVYYLLSDDPSPHRDRGYVPSPAYSRTPSGAPARVHRWKRGDYIALLPGFVASDSANVQVSAYGSTRNHCNVAAWGSRYVRVQCWSPEGTPSDDRFSLLVTAELSDAWVHADRPTEDSYQAVVANNPADADPPAGARNGVLIERQGTGVYEVQFPGLSGIGNVQVTPAGWNNDSRCSVVRVETDSVLVLCSAPGGIAADSQFTLLATADERDGWYGWGTPPPDCSGVCPTKVVRSNSPDGSQPTLTPTGKIGDYKVEFDGMPAGRGGNVQVTSGDPWTYCSVRSWDEQSAYVACFDRHTGAPIGSDFTLRYVKLQSERGAARPTVTILSPRDGSRLPADVALEFTANASDPEGDLSADLEWSSDLQGRIGAGAELLASLVTGIHTITASVTDSMGDPVSDQIRVSVAPNEAPTLEIQTPAEGSRIPLGDLVTFSASASDPEDTDLTIRWSLGHAQLGSGNTYRVSTLGVGTHTFTASVTDSQNATATATRTVEIEPPANQPPVVTIQWPRAGGSFVQGTTVSFSASASDPEDGNLTAQIQWKSNSGQIVQVGDSFRTSTLGVGSHTLTASVTDSQNATATATRTVEIVPPNQPPMVTIQSPDSEDSFVQGTQVEFSASATDPEDGNLSAQIQWKSSSGELLHVGDSFQISTLGLGTHTFTASVTDSENASASTWVRIEVTPDPALDVLRGTYQREPVQNAWHAGEITREGDLLRWTNQAGVSWILVPDLANQVLHTKSDNPYYGDPAARDFQLIWTDGLLTGFRFYSETYTRPLEQACFSAIFAQVVWHPSRSPDIFERFCAGPNPQERIACFEGQLQQHDDPDRAVRVCGDSGPGEDPLGAPGTYLTDADLEAFKSFRHKRSVTVEGADWAVSSWLGDELCLQRNTCSDGHIQGAASWDNGRGWVFAHDNVGINSIGGAMYVVCRDGSCGVHRLTTYSKDEDWDHPSGIQVAGNILAIAADRTYFVDLSNEASPRQLSCTILDKGAAGITYHPFHKRWFVVVGGRLYVSSNHLLEDCGFEKVGHDIQTSEGISQMI
jgi:hypothetical protein